MTPRPGDLVRINLPESVQPPGGYVYHGYAALVIGVRAAIAVVLLDGAVRCFAVAYLEVVDETR